MIEIPETGKWPVSGISTLLAGALAARESSLTRMLTLAFQLQVKHLPKLAVTHELAGA